MLWEIYNPKVGYSYTVYFKLRKRVKKINPISIYEGMYLSNPYVKS
jgi:hypothetical protein